MIPVLKPGSVYAPSFSIFYKDMLSVIGDYLKTFLHDFDDSDELYSMIKSKFQYYECVVGDINMFFNFMTDTYYEYYQYYQELLTNYNKQYDYALGNKRTVSRMDSSTTNKTGWNYDENNTENKHYDLPNKTVNDPDGYMTSKSKSEDVLDNKNGEDTTNAYNSSVVTTYDNEFLDLKRKYLAQIRNVYSEFADKFKDCFMKVYN